MEMMRMICTEILILYDLESHGFWGLHRMNAPEEITEGSTKPCKSSAI